MTNKPLRLMVDTNVWVDNYCGWHEGCESARGFLDVALGLSCELLFPVHESKDLLFVVWQEYRRMAAQHIEGPLPESLANAAREIAYGCLHNLCELATAVGADVSDLWLARKYLSVHKDFEDNLVLAACRRAGADYLVTNDQKLLRHADVCAKTPEEMRRLLLLQA